MKRADGTKFRQTTPAEIAYIREHWATMTCVEIEAAIGVRRGTVKQIASNLGLAKERATLSAVRFEAQAKRKQRRGGPRKLEPPIVGNTRRDRELRTQQVIDRMHRAAQTLGRVRWMHARPPTDNRSIGRVHRILDDEDLAA